MTDTVVVGYLDNGQWSACFGLSYRDLLIGDLITHQRIYRPGGKELRQLCASGGISVGRNAVARDFLDQTDGDWLWFIDTDMGFAPDTVERLLEAADPVERPVVGGLAFALKRDGFGNPATMYAERWKLSPTVYDMADIPERQEVGFAARYDYPRNELTPVGGTGAACLLIHRSALERVREKYGDAWFDHVTHPTGFGGKPRVFSEDLSFCVRLAGVGIQPHVHTGVKTVHEKGGIFLTEEEYDRRRNVAKPALRGEPRISILCPTRGRPEEMRRMAESAVSTAQGPIEVVFYLDDDDSDSLVMAKALADVMQVKWAVGPRIVLSEMWNVCAQMGVSDVMMHAGDDLIFRTPGWDTTVLNAFDEYDDRIVFVHGNDLLQGDNLGTHGFLHRRWIEAVGRFVPPHFSSDFNDTWLTEVADALGRRTYLEDVVTEHMHPLAGKASWDATHYERLQRHKRDDVAALYASLAEERAADVAKLRAVMS